MSKDKIELWTPWEWEEMTAVLPGEEPQGTTIMSSGGHYVCHQFNIRPIEKRKEIAHAICSAINNTYGQNINPEYVPEMLKALLIAKNYIEYAINKGAIGECKKDLEIINFAIEKSKL